MIASYRTVVLPLECSELELDPIYFYTEEVLDTNVHEHFSLHRQMDSQLPASILEKEPVKPQEVLSLNSLGKFSRFKLRI